jgi:hypothetical protein
LGHALLLGEPLKVALGISEVTTIGLAIEEVKKGE